MKCNNCGYEFTNNLVKNIEIIADKVNELGEDFSSIDIAILGDELELSDRQVRKYMKIIENIGQQEFIERVKNGESINSLEGECKKKKSSLYKAYKSIKQDYDIDFIEFRNLMKQYKKGGGDNE